MTRMVEFRGEKTHALIEEFPEDLKNSVASLMTVLQFFFVASAKMAFPIVVQLEFMSAILDLVRKIGIDKDDFIKLVNTLIEERNAAIEAHEAPAVGGEH